MKKDADGRTIYDPFVPFENDPAAGQSEFRKTGEKKRRTGGRKPGPDRFVIQIRHRSGGKVSNVLSFTVFCSVTTAMKRIQNAFTREECSRCCGHPDKHDNTLTQETL
jgi:hypothetical protein